MYETKHHRNVDDNHIETCIEKQINKVNRVNRNEKERNMIKRNTYDFVIRQTIT